MTLPRELWLGNDMLSGRYVIYQVRNGAEKI